MSSHYAIMQATEHLNGDDSQGNSTNTKVRPKFKNGEKVLCFHGPLMYEAKCLEIQTTNNNTVKYFVHYTGWSKNWDEWVSESRIFKHTQSNLNRQRTIKDEYENKKKLKSGKKKSDKPSATTTIKKEDTAKIAEHNSKQNKKKTSKITTRPKPPQNLKHQKKTKKSATKRKAKKKTKKSQESALESRPSTNVKLNFSTPLRFLIIDDNDIINRHRKLYEIPARIMAADILDDYYKETKTDENEKQLEEVVESFKTLLDDLLGTQLLYKFERPQYADILKEYPNKPLSQLYGGIHILRLLVRLQDTLISLVDESLRPKAVRECERLIKFLHDNRQKYFSYEDYFNPLTEYYRRF